MSTPVSLSFAPSTQGPKFGKKSLSFYLRSECPRQFRLSLYNDRLLKSGAMPPRTSNRPVTGATQAGDAWQNRVVAEVESIFGTPNVHVNPLPPPAPGSHIVQRPASRELIDDLPHLQPHQFVVEGIFELADAFKKAFGLHDLRDADGLGLEWSRLNPDIIQVLPAKEGALLVSPDGRLQAMASDDGRLQLRVIDVKLASEPGAHYFGEIAYYSMALAAWLEEQGWDDRFVVSARAAVWPGSYERSVLSEEHAEQKTGAFDLARLFCAMEEDLELIIFPVYASRLARFFRRELPELLQAPWRDLPWHPNFRCQNCDYLGYDWQARLAADPKFAGTRVLPDPAHCWQEAQGRDLVCRVPGLTRGGAQTLQKAVTTVGELASLDADHAVWDEHSNLRGRKHVLRARAASLTSRSSGIVQPSGACATMPAYADLKIWMSVDYDPSSAITAALSLRAEWYERAPRAESLVINPDLERHSKNWGRKGDESARAGDEYVRVIDARRVEAEGREFLRFLESLQAIFDEVTQAEKPRIEAGEVDLASRKAAGAHNALNRERFSTFQIYLWDDAQFRHLQRLITRHLEAILANPKLKGLAWLFPAPQLLADDALAGRTSPITLVQSAVDGHVAVPVPHHYTLLEVAEHFLPDGMTAPFVKWNFREPLTNMVPSERIHEWWTRADNWAQVLQDLTSTSRQKTFALSLVTQRLYDEARAKNLTLAESTAPCLSAKTDSLTGVPDESRLWFQYLKLNSALSRIEAEILYAMPPEARELRGKAAHLTRRLTPDECAAALPQINASCGVHLSADAELAIYALSPASREINMKPGEFGALLSPRDEPLFALKGAAKRFPYTMANLAASWWRSVAYERLCEVEVEAIDRTNLFVALRLKPGSILNQADARDGVDFSRDVMLDSLSGDVLAGKVKKVLERIGTPPFAISQNNIGAILPPAKASAPPAKTAKLQPAHEFLFDALSLSQQSSGRDAGALRTELEAEKVRLNSWQWTAWQEALEKRLSIIWGPPGTGKSATLRAVCRAAVRDAQNARKPLRLLITAHTYSAVDELLGKLAQHFTEHPVAGVSLYRVQSSLREAVEAPQGSLLQAVQLRWQEPSAEALELAGALKNPEQKIVIVGTVPSQLHNLALVGVKGDSASRTQQAWFDFVLLDEASQMDVASSTLIWSKMAPGGSCVLAGDDLQMAPIHQAEPPLGQEHLVGSIYGYFAEHWNLKVSARHALNINYRSNAPIVDCVREAGYDAHLQSHSPQLELNLRAPLPQSAPAGWPSSLPFSPHYSDLLDPQKPAGCFVYPDPNLSGQSNDFEAQSVAALLRVLYGRMAEPKNARDEFDQMQPEETLPLSLDEFWQRGVGVVAPHRAQGSKIVESLRAAFADTHSTPAQIRDAVDTVERFQGQERAVIIASFGLGDPDMVALEDDFLFSLNRFNVLISRAKCKVLVFMSRAVLDFLSDDQEVVRHSALLKSFAEVHCRHEISLDLPFWEKGVQRTVPGEFRFSGW